VQTGEAVDASAPADISGNVRVEVTGDVVLSGAVVTAANPGWAIPFPLITIPAAGTVSVGDYTVTAEAPVTIDMLKRLVYDADGKSAWHKIDNRRFPDFPAGQDLTVSGNCSVNPQWRWR
jgi:phage-related protein